MTRSRNSRTTPRPAHHALAACGILAATFIAATGASSANADILQEQHVDSLLLVDVMLPSVDSRTLSFPKFDTYGGERTLIGITAEYGHYFDASLYVGDNLAPHAVASQGSFSLAWTGELGDDSFLPSTAVDVDQIYTMGLSFWAEREAFAPSDVWRLNGAGTHEDILGDQSYLDAFTGDGFLDINSTLAFSEMVYSAPSEGMPPGCEFDPDILQVCIDTFQFDVTVTYHYTPEPTSLALLAFGALALMRRR